MHFILFALGSSSNGAIAGVSNEYIEQEDDNDNYNVDNIANSIHIHVTNVDGVDNHVEEIRWAHSTESELVIFNLPFIYSVSLIFQYNAYC